MSTEDTADRIGKGIRDTLRLGAAGFIVACILSGLTGFLIIFATLPWQLIPWLQRVLGE